MLGYNRIMLMGHVTRDPELRQLPGNADVPTSLAEFGLAANRRYRTAGGDDREETLFIECTVFGKSADTIARYVKKGRPLFVEGRLRYETWEDAQGAKRSKISVVVENFQFLGTRDDASADRPAENRAGDGRPGENRAGWKQRSESRKRPVKVAQADIPF